MTGEELVKYINALSSSYASQTIDGNYGIGAKISTVTRNHAGVRYLSWKANDEDGASVVLWKDPITSNYGLKQLKGPNDQYGHWTYVEDDVKPDQIKSPRGPRNEGDSPRQCGIGRYGGSPGRSTFSISMGCLLSK